MKRLKISSKLFFTHTTISLVVIVVLSYTFYIVMRDALIQRTIDQLSSINILKKDLIEVHFKESRNNLEALQLENIFFNLYVASKGNNSTPDSLTFTEINDLLKLYSFKNLHLVDNNNHQIFSTTRDSLPQAFLEKLDLLIRPDQKSLKIIDASAWSSEKKTLILYYLPIIENAEVVGKILVEEDFQKIQDILFENTGMGSTGESYIVAKDYFMRSSSRLSNALPLTIKVETEATRNSFANLSGNHIITDYRNKKVLSVYRHIGNIQLDWSLVSEMDFSEAMAPIIQLRNYLIAITLAVILLIVLATFFLSNAIAKPILQLKEIIISLSKGIITPIHRVPITTTDEISQIAEAIDQLIDGLKRTTMFAQEIGSGNFETTFRTLSDSDTLGLALIHMRDELKKIRDKEVQLERERTAALLEGQENERKRITQELHDGVGQMLTAIRMRIDLLDSSHESKAEIKNQINETVAEVKRISYNVMPHVIIDYGLEAALNGLCDNIKKYSSLNIDFRYVKEVEHKLSFEKSIAIFRIAQEGLNNIIKHASASNVSLHILDNEEEVCLFLDDDGKGFKEKEILNKDGVGLINIHERAKVLNGYAQIHSSEKGTSIEVHIPTQMV